MRYLILLLGLIIASCSTPTSPIFKMGQRVTFKDEFYKSCFGIVKNYKLWTGYKYLCNVTCVYYTESGRQEDNWSAWISENQLQK
jgi:hypothetical protein